MANTILLEQHWYGSAPLGLATSRGFQTIARSRGLVQDASLETHCVYRRPAWAGPARPAPSGRETALPVNWGWFALDREQIILHRIGYAGTDEGGRPGNFLAHNLVARREDLEKIDFDVPVLFHWVSRCSPIRYTLDDGGDDGFARNYRQLYARHGQDRQKLQNVEPLEVPAADLFHLRRLDADAPESFAEVLPDLLRCLLCPPEQRRLILVAGLSQGEQDSAREQKLIDLLFGLLPFPCRQTLTYSTYESEPASLVAPPRTGTAAAAFRQRRLFLAPAGIDLRLPNNPRLWLLHLAASQVQAPPTSFLAEELSAAAQGRALERLSAWREACGAFTSAAGLAPLESLWRLTRNDRKLTAAEIADAWSLPLPDRPGRTEVRELVGSLLSAGEDACPSASADRTKLGLRYLELLRLTPPTSQELSDDAPALQALEYLCRWCLQEGQPALFAGLLKVLGDPPGDQELAKRVAASLAAVQATLTSAQQFHSLVDCWAAQVRRTAGEQSKLLPCVGEALLRMLLGGADRLARQVKPERILALIQYGKITTSADLERFFDLLRDVLPDDESVSRAGQALAAALRDGRIPLRLVDSVTNSAPLALLRSHVLWLAVARDEALAGRGLEQWLRNPLLLKRFCESCDPPDHYTCQGLQWLIDELIQTQHQEQRREAVACYEGKGADQLAAQLAKIRAAPPRYLTNIHTRILEFARRKDQASPALERHLCTLLGLLLPWADRQDQLRSVLEMWKRWYTEPAGRIAVLSQALKHVPASLEQNLSPNIETGFVDLLRGLGLDEQEAWWCGRYVYRGLLAPAEDLARLCDETTVDLLLHAPELVAATGTPFEQWFAGQLRPCVWSEAARRVAEAWRQADARELQTWFVKPQKTRLLRILWQNHLPDGLGEALADCYRSQPGWRDLAQLGGLLAAAASTQDGVPAGLPDFLSTTIAGLLQLLLSEADDVSTPAPPRMGGLMHGPKAPR